MERECRGGSMTTRRRVGDFAYHRKGWRDGAQGLVEMLVYVLLYMVVI